MKLPNYSKSQQRKSYSAHLGPVGFSLPDDTDWVHLFKVGMTIVGVFGVGYCGYRTVKLVFDCAGKDVKKGSSAQPAVLPEPEPLKFQNLHQAAASAKDIDFLIPHWITAGRINVLASRTGLGKTNFAASFAVSLASGQPFTFLEKVEPKKPIDVFYLESELEESGFKKRGYGDFIYNGMERLYYLNIKEFKTASDLMSAIERSLRGRCKDAVCIVDHLSYFSDIGNSIGAGAFINQANDIIERAQKNQGITVTFFFLIHVDLKNQSDSDPVTLRSVSGAANICNGAKSVITLEKAIDGNVLLKNLKLTDDEGPGKLVLMKRVMKPVLHFQFVQYVSPEEEGKYLPQKVSAKSGGVTESHLLVEPEVEEAKVDDVKVQYLAMKNFIETKLGGKADWKKIEEHFRGKFDYQSNKQNYRNWQQRYDGEAVSKEEKEID